MDTRLHPSFCVQWDYWLTIIPNVFVYVHIAVTCHKVIDV